MASAGVAATLTQPQRVRQWTIVAAHLWGPSSVRQPKIARMTRDLLRWASYVACMLCIPLEMCSIYENALPPAGGSSACHWPGAAAGSSSPACRQPAGWC